MGVGCPMHVWMVLVSALYLATQAHRPCSPRDFGEGSVVCVCNATYCDDVEPNTPLPPGSYAQYLSTKAGLRLHQSTRKFASRIITTGEDVVISIDRNQSYQSILGFGGAFTDAAGINMAALSDGARDRLLKSYFAPEGIEYTVGRVPMGSCDFSTHAYSYDDTPGDLHMQKFSLTKEDLKYKIPNIRRAIELQRRRSLTMFASPWSAPAWMKTNGNMTGKGRLKGEPGGGYYKAWALYFVRFLQEYAKHNITFWGVTTQNEPTTGQISHFSYQALGFTAELQRDFVAFDLGPALEKHGYGDVKIMVLDDQRVLLPGWAQTIMQSPQAAKYVSGIAVHWYLDWLVPPLLLENTHNAMPAKFLLATEACEGSKPWQKSKVILGSWERFESYAKDIMDDLQHWVTGWTDWNLALDLTGGPNWVANFVDSAVIVNKDRDEFYKQPMFYAMGHFSKFLTPGARRISSTLKGGTKNLQVLAFTTLEKSTVVLVSNRDATSCRYRLIDPVAGVINAVAPPRSLQTLVWWT